MPLPSIFRHPGVIRYVLRYPRIFALGWREAHTSNGVTYDDDPWSPRSQAYDVGRDIRKWGRA